MVIRYMLLRERYQEVLQGLVDHYDVPRVIHPSPVVSADTGWTRVLQHTEWYIGGSGDSQSHYRYRRYMTSLAGLKPGSGREASVDLGCGAGLFSWVFLDWARQNGMEHDRVGLYGFDHCPAMLRLAQEARQRLMEHVPDYPILHCSENVDTLCDQLAQNHVETTEYTITLGHVLAQIQTHWPDAIQNLAQVIVHVVRLGQLGSHCILVAVDAAGAASAFSTGWATLLDSLVASHVQCEYLRDAPVTKLVRLTV